MSRVLQAVMDGCASEGPGPEPVSHEGGINNWIGFGLVTVHEIPATTMVGVVKPL